LEGEKMKRFLLGNFIVIALVAITGISCEPPPQQQPDMVPLPTVYAPITTTTAVAAYSSLRVDEMGIPAATEGALVGPDTPCQEWLPLAIQVGWPKDREVAEKLLSVMWRESRCQPGAINQKDPNGGSLGLLQINKFWCKPNQYTVHGYLQEAGVLSDCAELYDPAVNLTAAAAIYNYSVDRNGNGWHPWKV
jgi:hypothetical protein